MQRRASEAINLIACDLSHLMLQHLYRKWLAMSEEKKTISLKFKLSIEMKRKQMTKGTKKRWEEETQESNLHKLHYCSRRNLVGRSDELGVTSAGIKVGHWPSNKSDRGLFLIETAKQFISFHLNAIG